ncbi:MAG TPA: NAD+ synthase [Candidatus Acidoferrales bacterium]|jgi:NAD+ synthase/NAD+ synthase (glutamine-hydrolysing)|nr:NAD+ synthase [Candidatus Acidoferrales bacterium]
MKIALAQLNPTVGDFAGNSAKILDYSRRALEKGADLAVFSELCICGYLPMDLIERPHFIDRNERELARLAKLLPLPAIVGYAAHANGKTGKSAANAAALLANGKVEFVQHKMLLPTYDVFDESRYFQPAAAQNVFLFGGQKLGITICEDIWNDKTFWAKPLYERDPVSELAAQHASMIINISGSPYTIGKRTLRSDMLRSLAKSHNLPVVYVNQVGGNDSLVFDGGSVVVLPDGRIAAQAKSFEEDLVLFDTATSTGEVHAQPADELEHVLHALICGTRDYVHKSGFRGVVVGLSGGIDSSVVAAIAVAALGSENVQGVSMPGPYSSEGSRKDARQLADNLEIKFLTIPITDVFQTYKATLADAFQGRAEDVTEENLQARVRGNLLMALSNKFGSMVISTGNKSEMAVGYCTLYGDMAGGLAMLSDVPKTMVYALVNYINRDRELIPRSSVEKPPSAELRPNQKDQDSLPPYEILDQILKAYIEELKCPEEIAAEFNIDIGLVRSIAAKFDRNEYKRRQAPPGLKITSRAFGLGRPFPIVQKFIP